MIFLTDSSLNYVCCVMKQYLIYFILCIHLMKYIFFSNHNEIRYHSKMKWNVKHVCLCCILWILKNEIYIYVTQCLCLKKKLQAKFRFNFLKIPSSAQSLNKACSTISLFSSASVVLLSLHIWKVNKWSNDVNCGGTGGCVSWKYGKILIVGTIVEKKWKRK